MITSAAGRIAVNPPVNTLPGGFSRITTIAHSEADRIACDLAAAARAVLNVELLKSLSTKEGSTFSHDLRSGIR